MRSPGFPPFCWLPFFAFVGWNKAFAPLGELARHRAWTIHLPETLGRVIGWSEMLFALGLLCAFVPRLRRFAPLFAFLLIVNQLAAAAVHASLGEFDALPPNAGLVLLLALLAWLLRPAERKAAGSNN